MRSIDIHRENVYSRHQTELWMQKIMECGSEEDKLYLKRMQETVLKNEEEQGSIVYES